MKNLYKKNIMNKHYFLEFTILDKKYYPNKNYILYKNIIIIELFNNLFPEITNNFCSLFKNTNYKNNKVFRIVNNSFIQMGNMVKNNDIIFDNKSLEKNNKHNRPFLLSMSNNESNNYNSHFIITIESLPHLDGINVVFGKIIKGISTILIINNIPTYHNGKIIDNLDIFISNCGNIEKNNNKEFINVTYEKLLCKQIIINISNQIKKCNYVNKILYNNDYTSINNELINIYNYYKIMIHVYLLKIISNYKFKNYKNVIIDTNILLEIPGKFITNKNMLQILFYKLKSICEMNINNKNLLIKSKKIVEELYFINNNDIKIFIKGLKREEDKIINLLKIKNK